MECTVQTKHSETRKVVQLKPQFGHWRHCPYYGPDDKIRLEIGRITEVEKDSVGVERYFRVEYKKTKRVFATVKSTSTEFVCRNEKR